MAYRYLDVGREALVRSGKRSLEGAENNEKETRVDDDELHGTFEGLAGCEENIMRKRETEKSMVVPRATDELLTPTVKQDSCHDSSASVLDAHMTGHIPLPHHSVPSGRQTYLPWAVLAGTTVL